MSFGFKSINSDGIVQISDTETNYCLLQRGTAVSVAPSAGNSLGLFPISFWNPTGIRPLLFVRYVSSTMRVFLHSMPGHEYAWLAVVPDVEGYPVAGQVIEWAVFVPANSLLMQYQNVSHGLRVWRSDGTLAFDSGRPPPQIYSRSESTLALESGSLNYPEYIPISVPDIGGSAPFVCMNQFMGTTHFWQITQYMYFLLRFSVQQMSSSQFRIGFVRGSDAATVTLGIRRTTFENSPQTISLLVAKINAASAG